MDNFDIDICYNLLNDGIFQLENQEEAIQTNQKITKLPDQAIIWGIKEVIKRAKLGSNNAWLLFLLFPLSRRLFPCHIFRKKIWPKLFLSRLKNIFLCP